MHGITLTKSPTDWEIIQHEDGYAKIKLEGSYQVHKAAIEVGVESAIPIVRVVQEEDNSVVIPWTIADTIEEGNNFSGTFHTEILIPEGGLYRIDTSLETNEDWNKQIKKIWYNWHALWYYSGMENNIWLIIGILVLFVLISVLLLIKKWKKSTDDIDDMEGHEFEYFCAELLRNRGFLEVEVTKGSGDYGIDILAEKDGVTYAIQCKCYSDPVGIKAVQEAYAGRDFYDRMVGAVLSNQYFTTPAVETAKKLKILLWDRGYLESMMEE